MRRKQLQSAAILLSGILAATPAVSFLPAMTAAAAEPTYVMMNIPYSEFYASDDLQVDAVTSATLIKTRSSLAAGSYHNNADGSDISGVIYPVKVDDPSVLDNLNEVTDATHYDITVTMRGNSTTTTYSGADALFENAGDHAYYKLSGEPAYYKELTGTTQDGSGFVFSAIKGSASAAKAVTVGATLSTGAGAGARHKAYEITVDKYDNGAYPVKVLGAVLHTQTSKNSGTQSKYALRHLANIWRNGEFGIDPSETKYASAEGQWATGLTVYTDTGIDEVTFTEPLLLRKIGRNITASGSQDGKEITISGIPGDAVNAKATVTHTDDGKSETVVSGASVRDGKVSLSSSLTEGETYTVTVSSDNYSPAAASFTYQIFSDVPSSRWSHTAVLWAVNANVTSGYPNGAFGVTDPTTREQAAQFLYNLNEKPAPASDYKALTFTDVSRNDWSYDAILWASNNDVISGYPNNTFGEKDSCSREQIVQMLYNLEKKPYTSRAEAQKISKFSDFQDREHWSYDAVVWASDNNIIGGKSDGLFHAADTCSREEMAQILYNYNIYKQ